MNRNSFKKTVLLDTLLAACLVFGLGISMPTFAVDTGSHAEGTISDAGLTTNVKLRLASIQGLKGSDIKVTTNNGVVTLSGTVKDPHAKFAAVAAVISMEGVRVLDDELKTPSDYRMVAESKPARGATKRDVSDSRITADVKELLAERIPTRYKVDVTTTRGVVFLKGDLADRDMIERVRGMVVKVDGVKSVNTLGVDSPFITMAY